VKEYIDAVDLFAGGGGTSTGLVFASKEISKKVSLVAINHNREALATHMLNFPWAWHLLSEVQTIDPSEIIPDGHLDVLAASPSCTFFSRARGGKPIRPQDRVSPWFIGKWVAKLDIPRVLIENVPEIVNWGPLYPKGHEMEGRPIPERKGEYFRLWRRMFEKLGYAFDYRILNAADYGDPTTRKRFFAIARNDGLPISWPAPTHNSTGSGGLKKWQAARNIINWSIPGESIFDRKKPLAPNTLKRIFIGMEKFSSPELKPFIINLAHTMLKPENAVRDIDSPLPTVATEKGGAFSLVQPFILPVEGVFRGNTPKDINDPLGAITQRGYGGLVEPFLLSQTNDGMSKEMDRHVMTFPAVDKHRLVQAFLVENKGRSSAASISAPLPAVTTVPYHGLVEPFLIEYYGKGGAVDIEDPVPTVTTKQRFALVRPQIQINGRVYTLEITYRMLRKEELAAAMGFPKDYKFVGSQADVTKQIGNAVAVNIAKSLFRELLADKPSGQSTLGTAS
jgi:DNA (cytosine-5)-methyltransferase 1